MRISKQSKNFIFALGLVIILLFNSVTAALAQEQGLVSNDVQKPLAKEDGDWEKEVELSDQTAIAKSLVSDFGYSDQQVNAFFEANQRLQKAYASGASQNELDNIAKEYDAILQAPPTAKSLVVISAKWLLRFCRNGAEAKYDVQLGPHAGAFAYLNTDQEFKVHTKLGFRAWPTYTTITHTSATPGFYFIHIASGIKLKNHKAYCRG